MTRFLIIAALFCLAVPAALAAPPAGKGKPANPGQSAASSQSAEKNASKVCKAERGATAQTIDAFNANYGSNANKKNAFGKCVSMQAKKQQQAAEQAEKNAAKACKAEQADPNFAGAHGGKSFADFYGTNANKKNAFGKCVSMKAKQQGSS